MGRVRGASSLVTKVDIVVALNEEVVASATSTLSPLSLMCVRGIDIDGGVVHGRWQPASIHALGRLRAAGDNPILNSFTASGAYMRQLTNQASC